jgi:hypothetical protein
MHSIKAIYKALQPHKGPTSGTSVRIEPGARHGKITCHSLLLKSSIEIRQLAFPAACILHSERHPLHVAVSASAHVLWPPTGAYPRTQGARKAIKTNAIKFSQHHRSHLPKPSAHDNMKSNPKNNRNNRKWDPRNMQSRIESAHKRKPMHFIVLEANLRKHPTKTI